ncbi:UvrD-helicase domain-containing protein [Streptomyces sp. MJM8645]|uniref:UvrD-helicase domain-containing protein n=1 Tax=Streptomyces sp. MJM8645 TaxID=1120523 RepID=UPI0013312755|nr:UvrD-helicase domain-containing protein [Streptomyces sp. MJM8645]
MPHENRTAARLEVKVTRRPWNPALHPRDSKGRFVETGGIARLWGGGLARVLRALAGDKVLVERLDNGSREKLYANRLTMVSRPDGSAPTASEDKVLAEDAKREVQAAAGGRGDGITKPDVGDPRVPVKPHAKGDDDQHIPDEKPTVASTLESWRRGEVRPLAADTERPQDARVRAEAARERADMVSSAQLTASGRHMVGQEGDRWRVYEAATGRVQEREHASKRDALRAAEDLESGPIHKQEGWRSYTPEELGRAAEKVGPPKGPASEQPGHRRAAAREIEPGDFVVAGNPRADGGWYTRRVLDRQQHGEKTTLTWEGHGGRKETLTVVNDGAADGFEVVGHPYSHERWERDHGSSVPSARMEEEARAKAAERAAKPAGHPERHAGVPEAGQAGERTGRPAGRDGGGAGDKADGGGEHRGGSWLSPGESAPRRFRTVTEVRYHWDDGADPTTTNKAQANKDRQSAFKVVQLTSNEQLSAGGRFIVARTPRGKYVVHHAGTGILLSDRHANVGKSGKLFVRKREALLVANAAEQVRNDRGELFNWDGPHLRDRLDDPEFGEAFDRAINDARSGHNDDGHDQAANGRGGEHGESVRAAGLGVREDVPADSDGVAGRRGGAADALHEGGPAGDRSDRDADERATRDAAGAERIPGAGAGEERGGVAGAGDRAGRRGVPAEGAGDGGSGPSARRGVAAGRFRARSQDDLAPAGERARLRANVEALRTLRRIQVDDRPATEGEKRVLARWSGWGSLPTVLADEPRRGNHKSDEAFQRAVERWKAFAGERAELRALLDDSEWAAAQKNTLNAHYTDQSLVDAVWQAMGALGFDGGNVLEPGSGSGNFIGAAPAGTHMTGVELDPTTAAISRALYPDAQILTESFAKTRAPHGGFDGVVGNVPFGDIKLTDPVHNKGRKLSIHDHFIKKSLELTRPGGLVAVVSSRYTMDSKDPHARREMAKLGDLVGAIRLPEGAHEKAAGTHVVTDVLVFRRRAEGEAPGDQSWVESTPVDVNGHQIEINRYFQQHPDNVLGELTTGRGQFTDHDLTVRGDKDAAPALREALARITAQAKAEGRGFAPHEAGPRERIVLQAAADRKHEGAINARPDGTFTQVVDGQVRKLDVHHSQVSQLRDLLELRNLTTALLDEESSHDGDGETEHMATLRAELNRAYAAYTAAYAPLDKPGQNRVFTPDEARVRAKDGGLEKVPDEWKAPTALALFDDDFASAFAYGLDRWNDSTKTAAKAEILHQRVVAPRKIAERADSPDQAVSLAMEHDGELRLSTLARLMGTSESDALEQLGTRVFRDPRSGHLLPAADYLSGDVRKKLAVARRHLAAGRDDMASHVAALEAVVPRDLVPGEISAKMGAPWIGEADVTAFLREILETPHVRAEYGGGSMWVVKGPSQGIASRVTWGTKSRSAAEIAEAVLQQKQITVTRKRPDGGSVVDDEATADARDKATAMAARFAAWVWEDEARAARLAKIYNDRFNGIALRDYSDVQLTLPGITAGWRMRPHQNAAIARILNEPSALLAHEVGAGKTATMVAATQELRRTGLAKKPAIVVPNHMLAQFRREYLELYPNAKVLAASSADLTGKKRRKFIARAATGDWDAVILTHSAFGKIPMTPANRRAYMEEELARLRQQIADAKARDGQSLTLKQLENALTNAEEAMEKRLEQESKDTGAVYWEQTGVDYLMIDEAHEFKNLRTVSSIPGAAVTGSAKASDLHMKVEYLRGKSESGRVLTFATGTPIANSVTEAYTMKRYLRPDLLDAAGINDFDAWAATFGDVVTDVEVKPDGSGFQEKARFAQFRNVPELLRMYRVAADVQTAADLNLPTPRVRRNEEGKRGELRVVPISAEQKRYIEGLPNHPDAKEPGGILKIIGLGKRAAIDPRLVGGSGEEGGKIDHAAREIASIYRENKDVEFPTSKDDPTPQPLKGALQLVFMDQGVPGSKAKGGLDEYGNEQPAWNAYEYMRERLVESGVPREQIRFIHEAGSDKAKAKLFEDARNGKIAVLIGSTTKMGTGTNIQDRAVALHHMDYPWRPADMAQREGRIERQGNLHYLMDKDVRIISWITEETFDAFNAGTLERKAKFIAQMNRRNFDLREMEDIGDTAVSFAVMKALATGNTTVLDHAKAVKERVDLQRADVRWHRQQDEKRRATDVLTQHISWLDGALDTWHAARAQRTETRGDAFTMTLPGGQESAKRKEAGAEVLATVRAALGDKSLTSGDRVKLGRLGGHTAHATIGYDIGGNRIARVGFDWPLLHSRRISGTSGTYGRDELGDGAGAGMIASLENRLDGLDDLVKDGGQQLVESENELEKARRGLGGQPPYGEALKASERRVALLAQLITAEQKKKELRGRGRDDKELVKATKRVEDLESRLDAERPPQDLIEMAVDPDPDIRLDSPDPTPVISTGPDGKVKVDVPGMRRDSSNSIPEQRRGYGERPAASQARGEDAVSAAPQSSTGERAHPSTLTDEQIAHEMASLEPDLLGDGEVGSQDVARHAVLTNEQARRTEKAEGDTAKGPGGSWQEMQAEQADGQDAGLFGAADVHAAQPTQQTADEYGTPDMFADAEGVTDRLKASRLHRGDRYIADDGTVAEVADQPEQLGKGGKGGVRVRTTDGRTLMHRSDHVFRRADDTTPSGQQPAAAVEEAHGSRTPEPEVAEPSTPEASASKSDAPTVTAGDNQPSAVSGGDATLRHYDTGEQIVTPDGPGWYVGAHPDGQHFVNVEGRYAAFPDHAVHRPGEHPPAEVPDQTAAADEARRAKLERAATPEGITLDYGARLHSLDEEAGHGWIADKDGNTIGWVRSRPDQKGRTAWWGQDGRGGAPEGMTWHDKMPAKAGIPPIRVATHVAQGIDLGHRGEKTGPSRPGSARQEVTFTEAQVRELSQLAQPDPEEPIGWRPGVFRRYQMRSDHMRTLRDAAKAAADQADTGTAAGRRRQKVLLNAAEKLDREAYETDRTQATLPKPGESDPFADPYAPPADAMPEATARPEVAASGDGGEGVSLDRGQVQAELDSLRPSESSTPAAGDRALPHWAQPKPELEQLTGAFGGNRPKSSRIVLSGESVPGRGPRSRRIRSGGPIAVDDAVRHSGAVFGVDHAYGKVTDAWAEKGKPDLDNVYYQIQWYDQAGKPKGKPETVTAYNNLYRAAEPTSDEGPVSVAEAFTAMGEHPDPETLSETEREAEFNRLQAIAEPWMGPRTGPGAVARQQILNEVSARQEELDVNRGWEDRDRYWEERPETGLNPGDDTTPFRRGDEVLVRFHPSGRQWNARVLGVDPDGQIRVEKPSSTATFPVDADQIAPHGKDVRPVRGGDAVKDRARQDPNPKAETARSSPPSGTSHEAPAGPGDETNVSPGTGPTLPGPVAEHDEQTPGQPSRSTVPDTTLPEAAERLADADWADAQQSWEKNWSKKPEPNAESVRYAKRSLATSAPESSDPSFALRQSKNPTMKFSPMGHYWVWTEDGGKTWSITTRTLGEYVGDPELSKVAGTEEDAHRLALAFESINDGEGTTLGLPWDISRRADEVRDVNGVSYAQRMRQARARFDADRAGAQHREAPTASDLDESQNIEHVTLPPNEVDADLRSLTPDGGDGEETQDRGRHERGQDVPAGEDSRKREGDGREGVSLDPGRVKAELDSIRPGEPSTPTTGAAGSSPPSGVSHEAPAGSGAGNVSPGTGSAPQGAARNVIGERPVAEMSRQELDDELSGLDDALDQVKNSTDPLDLAWRRRAELRQWEALKEYNRKTEVTKPADRSEEIQNRLDGYGLRADEGEGRNVERIEDMPPAKPGAPSDAEWEQIDAAAAGLEEYPPTVEQSLIHEAVARRGLNAAVMALAGTGKSSTLKQLSRRMPGKKIDYLAFNRSVAEEAKQAKAKGEYADNVTPQTANGMAFRAVNKRYQDAGRDLGQRLPQDGDGGAKRQTAQTVADLMRVYDWVEYAPGKSLKPSSAAYQARDLVARWCQSADEEMGPQHLNLPPWIEEEHRDALFEALKPIADRMWADVLDPHGKLTYDQDYIVKQWALSGFKVDSDVIFFDEAQDVNPVLDGVVRAAMGQGVQVVAVGDSNQSIYGFRGATDALARFPVDARLTLTQSFRFGPEIAEAGNRFLRLSGTEMRLKGLAGKQSWITELGPDDADAVLCRTNATAVIEAIDALDRGKRVAVAGGLDEIRKFVEAARQLQAGEKTNHKDLADFAAWDDVVEYVEQESEAAGSMRTLVQLIENDTDGKLDRLLESGGLASDIRVSDDGERLWISGTRFGDPDHEAFTRWLKDSKSNGFGKLAWDDQSKRWYYQPGTHTVTNRRSGRSWTVKNPAGNRDAALAAVKTYIDQHSHAPEDGEGGIVGEHQDPDVVISTAHKSKGLEWRRVRIADDFRGPELTESGEYDLTTMPSDEDLRLSYVAVTRATETLDAGGLGWVWEVTRSEDPMEAPDTDYPRDWTREDFTPGDTVLYVSEDGEQLLTGDVVNADTTLTVRDPQTGRTSTISLQQVRRRNGDPQPRAEVASDDELQAAIDSGRYMAPGSSSAVVGQHDRGSGSTAEDRSGPAALAGDDVDARSTASGGAGTDSADAGRGEDGERTAADAEQAVLHEVPRTAAGHDAGSGRHEDQGEARHEEGAERDHNAEEQLGGENEGDAEEAARRRRGDQEDRQDQGVDADRPRSGEHRDREANRRALDDSTAAEHRDGEHDSEHGSGKEDESSDRGRSRRRRRGRRGRPDGTNGGGPDLDGLGAPDVPLIGVPLPKGSPAPGGHDAAGEGGRAGLGSHPGGSGRSADTPVRRSGRVQPPTGVVASRWNPEEGGQVPNVVGSLAAAAGGHPDDAKEWNALLGEASAAAPLAQFDANVEHFLPGHDGPMREFLAERARLLRAEAEATGQRATADYLERLRAADSPAAGEAVYFGSYRGDGRRGGPGIIGEGRYYEELREAFARQRAQARAEAERRGLDADVVERFLLHADGADPDRPAAISAHSVEEPLKVARHDAFYAMVANLPEAVRLERFPGTLEEYERRSALVKAALQERGSVGRPDGAGALPAEPASGSTAAGGAGAGEERLARVRERFAGGEGIPGSARNRAYVARLGANPTLGVSPGGGVAYWSKDGGRTWEFGHARTGATIGSRDGSSVEGSREDAAAMAARYEGLVDAEGRPFPWDAPDAQAAGRGWRDAEGRRIGEAMRSVRDEHVAPQEHEEVRDAAQDLTGQTDPDLPTMDGSGQKLPDDLTGVDEGVLEAHLAVVSDQVAATGDWDNPELHRIADELDRRAAERGDYWRALAPLAAQASDAPPADDVARAAEEQLMDQLAGLYPTKETRREYLERVEAERQRLRHQYDNEYRPTIRSAVEDYTKGYLVRRESAQKARAARVKQEAEEARAAAEGRPARRVANGLRIDDPDYMLFEAPQSVFDKHASDELREWIEYHNDGERPMSFSRYYQQHLAGERQARAQWEDEQDAVRAAAGPDQPASPPVVDAPGDGQAQRPRSTGEPAAAGATPVPAEPEHRPSAAGPAAGQRPEAEQQDGVDRQKRVKEQGLPEPIGGRSAQWVAVEQLRTGDVARVEGSDENGNPVGRSGWVLSRREAVITRGGRTVRGHEVTMGDDAEGTSGRRGMVFVAAGEQAARADAPSEQGSMLTGAQLEAMTSRLDGDHPTDRTGVGLFPGSLVRGPGDREGMVTGVTASAVSVRYEGRRHDQDAAPGDLEVVDGGAARPAGWTPDGQHIKPGQVAVDPDTRQPVGVVQAVDGDAVEVATPQGIELADGGSLTVARSAQPDEAGPAIVALRPVPAGELAQGDVVLVDDAGRKTPVRVIGPPVRDGEHVVVDYEEVETGTRGQLRADRALLLPRASGASGQPADLSPQEAVTGIDDTRRATPAGTAPQADAGIVPQLTPAERARIHALGLGEADDPEAREAAERIEAGQPVTVGQARALEEALRQHADPRAGEGRTARRAADRLAQAAGGRPQEQDRAPVQGAAGDLVPGDVVAVPQGNGTSKPVVVTDSRPGPGGTQALTVEDAYGLAEEEVLPAAAPVHHLPTPQATAPAPAAKPAEPAPPAPSGASTARPRTSDVVAARARDAVDAVVEAAVDGVVPGTIHALRQSVAERLAPGAARSGERRAAADAAEALRRLGLEKSAHAHADQAVRHAAQKAREAAVKAVLRTLNDLEPLDGESEEETAQRAVRLLRRIPEGIDPTTFALVAMARSYRSAGGNAGSAAGAPAADRGDAAAAAGQRAGHAAASFAGRAVGSALGAALSVLRRRRLDQQQVEQIVQRTVQAMAEGQEQAAREIVDGVPPEARPGLFSRVTAALVRLARRVAAWLRELLRKVAAVWRGEDGERLQRVRERLARRLRWWPETREIEADIAAAAGETAGSAEAGADLTPWLAMLPAGRFGQVERTVSRWEPASTADLEAGRLPEAVEERRWTADRAVDGGPGPEALRHLAAVLGAGEALDSAVTDQMRQMAPELGNDPHERLRSVQLYAQTAIQRADRIAAEAAAGSRDAELELDSARAEARQAVADERRAQTAYAAALRDAARHALSRVRQLGNGGGLRASGEGAERLRGLEALLPADWLAAAGPLTVSAGAHRGSYHPQSRHLTVGESDATALHALAHHLQHSIPELAAAEEAYHWVRTSRGEVGARQRAPQVRLAQWFPGHGHHPRATARQGGWADLFTGSEPADGRSWEVLPTALEAMFSGSTWYLDDDLRQWLLGVMSTLGRRA